MDRDGGRGGGQSPIRLRKRECAVKLSVVDNRTRLARMAEDPAEARLRNEMDEQSAAFETAPAGLIMAWAVERFGPKLALSCSFQEAVLVDIAVSVDPDIEVIFLDTESHFPETLEYVEDDPRPLRPQPDRDLTPGARRRRPPVWDRAVLRVPQGAPAAATLSGK